MTTATGSNQLVKYKDLSRRDALLVVVELVRHGIWFEAVPQPDSICRICVLAPAWNVLWEVMAPLNIDLTGPQSG